MLEQDAFPFPFVFAFAIASGLAVAWAGRVELRERPGLVARTGAFRAYGLFVGLVLVPVSVYFYVFYGDWSLAYLLDTRTIPSAVALLAFVLEAALAAGAFLLGARWIRAERDGRVLALSGAALAAGVLSWVALAGRLSVVGTVAQHQGGFGLVPFGASALFDATLWMGVVVLVGLGYVLYRVGRVGSVVRPDGTGNGR